MYKLDIPLSLKEQAAIERRRRAEQERQGRIFNSKHRQIGVRILLRGRKKKDELIYILLVD